MVDLETQGGDTFWVTPQLLLLQKGLADPQPVTSPCPSESPLHWGHALQWGYALWWGQVWSWSHLAGLVSEGVWEHLRPENLRRSGWEEGARPPALPKATRRLGPVSSRTDHPGWSKRPRSELCGGPRPRVSSAFPQAPLGPRQAWCADGWSSHRLSLGEPCSFRVGGEPARMPAAGLAASSQPRAPLGTLAAPWPCLAPHTAGPEGDSRWNPGAPGT